jgi:hypothetical protein
LDVKEENMRESEKNGENIKLLREGALDVKEENMRESEKNGENIKLLREAGAWIKAEAGGAAEPDRPDRAKWRGAC